MVYAVDFDPTVIRQRDVAPSGIPAAHSLIKTASPGNSASRWLVEGVQFVPTLCTTLHNQKIADPCADWVDPGAGGGPAYQTCPGAITFDPFITEIAISVRMLPTVSRTQDWLTERFVLGLSQNIESIIWPSSAPAGGRPWLGGGTVVTPPASGGAYASLGAIEAAILSAQAGAGTVHMSPYVAAQVNESLVEDGSGILRTRATGSKVVVGNYPTDKIAAHIGDIDLYLGSTVYQDDAFDQKANTSYQHAWMDSAVAWHTCAAWVTTLA